MKMRPSRAGWPLCVSGSGINLFHQRPHLAGADHAHGRDESGHHGARHAAGQRVLSRQPQARYFRLRAQPVLLEAFARLGQAVEFAPLVSAEAIEAIRAKKNVRLLACGEWAAEDVHRLDFKRVNGGLLVQDADLQLLSETRVVSERAPTAAEMRDLLFGWRVAKFVKSNAIVYAKDGMTIGVGAGQMSRVNSARIAGIKAEHAGLAVRGSVMASDAFFPFRDGIDNAAAAGIAAVIQPGGSMRDEEVIAAANEHRMAMVFTGMRHFRH